MPIHPTAIVSPKAEVDSSAEIGPYVIIEEHATIGPDCRIAPNVYIGKYTRIGASNQIHTGTVLGDTPQDRTFKECRSYLQIGDNNIIREFVSIHRGTVPESTTSIGSDCFIMGYSHIAHNCQVADAVTMANMATLGGHAHVGERAFLSGHAMIHQFVRIGRLCMVGGGTRLTMDLPPFLMVIHENDVKNVNVVGLRRAGLSSPQISAIRAAYRSLYRGGMPFSKAVERLSTEQNEPMVQELLDFINAPTKRGIAGPKDRRKQPAAEQE